jgi:hypothetical protein
MRIKNRLSVRRAESAITVRVGNGAFQKAPALVGKGGAAKVCDTGEQDGRGHRAVVGLVPRPLADIAVLAEHLDVLRVKPQVPMAENGFDVVGIDYRAVNGASPAALAAESVPLLGLVAETLPLSCFVKG